MRKTGRALSIVLSMLLIISAFMPSATVLGLEPSSDPNAAEATESTQNNQDNSNEEGGSAEADPTDQTDPADTSDSNEAGEDGESGEDEGQEGEGELQEPDAASLLDNALKKTGR